MPDPVTDGPEWDETAYLMQNPAMAERLREAMQDVRDRYQIITPTVWSFDLTGTRDLTSDELNRADHAPEFGDGHITPEYGGGGPAVFHCDFPATTREEAVEAATEAIRRLGYDAELTAS
ncbi:hypothetical protein ACFY9G_22075 [Streptomyces anthocyanicus]|uniref:hypothetical protein n=1 Tax=Streptomyces anthocyanicus TaxID=68174 RepID=UPI0036E1087A